MDFRAVRACGHPGLALRHCPLPSNASVFDVLTHRVSTRVAGAGDEAIDAIGLRLSTRALLTAVLAYSIASSTRSASVAGKST